MIKYKIGDVVISSIFVEHLGKKISWRGTIKIIGPTTYPYDMDNPMLSSTECWVVWDNGSQSRKSMIDPDPNNLEIDKEHFRDEKLKELLKSEKQE